MAKGLYFGVDSKARKVKKMYFGVDGKARKVKKAYIGIDGKARLFYSSGEIAKSSATVSTLNLTSTHDAVSNGTYAFFRGTSYDDEENETFINVTAYNTSLTKKSPSAPYGNDDRRGSCMGRNSGYIVVNGGRRSRTMTYYSNYMDCYDASLTKTLKSDATGRIEYHVSETIGNNILFAGGSTGSGSTGTSSVFGYNSSLTTISSITSLSAARRDGIFHGIVGGYAVFAGGNSDGNLKTNVDAYNASLTKTTGTSLPTGMKSNSVNACYNDSYMICTYGAWNTASADCTTYAINSSLTVSSPSKPGTTPYYATGVATQEYAIIMGGYKYSNVGLNRMEGWDTSLTRTNLPNLTTARQNPGAAVIGEYLLVGGGLIGSHESSGGDTIYDYTNNVEAYTVS